jgi:DNA-binding NtrC family response regulator
VHINNGQKRTVLVIDDEESFAEVLAVSLAFEGFVVLKAYNGIDGLNIFAQNQKYITAVLCDLNLPKMNGSQVIQAILSLQPDMKIIVMTGAIDEASRTEFINHPSCIFLQKPFPTEVLIKSVKKEKV